MQAKFPHIEKIVLALSSAACPRDIINSDYLCEAEQEDFNRLCRYYGVKTKAELLPAPVDPIDDFNYVGSRHHY